MKNNNELLILAFGIMILSVILNNSFTFVGLGFGYLLFAFWRFPDKNEKNKVIWSSIKIYDSLIFSVAGLFLCLTAIRYEFIFVFIGLLMALLTFKFMVTTKERWMMAVIHSELWEEEFPKLVQSLENTKDMQKKWAEQNERLIKDCEKFKSMAMTYRRHLGVCKKAIRHRRMM